MFENYKKVMEETLLYYLSPKKCCIRTKCLVSIWPTLVSIGRTGDINQNLNPKFLVMTFWIIFPFIPHCIYSFYDA